MRAFALLTFLFMSACLNPDDVLPVHGRVFSSSGVANVPVKLTRSPVKDHCVFEGVEPFASTTTDADGGFRFELLRAQAMDLTFRGSFCFQTRAEFPSGAKSTDQRPISGDEDIGVLYDWVPGLSLDGAAIRLNEVAVLPDDERTTRIPLRSAQFLSDAGEVFVAHDHLGDIATPGPILEMRVAPEMIEDFSGIMKVEAMVLTTVKTDNPVLGRDQVFVNTIEVTDQLPFAGTTPSIIRGLPCGQSPFAICALNDGALELAAGGFGSPELTVALPAAREVRRLVLRGVSAATNEVVVTALDADGGAIGPFPYSWQSAVSRYFQSPDPVQLADGGFTSNDPAGDYVVLELDAGVVTGLSVTFPGSLISAEEISVF